MGGRFWKELGGFFRLQVLSSIFPIFVVGSLVLTRFFDLGIPRYDLMLVLCLLMQGFMVVARLETRREVLAICLFHALGIGLELYKVHRGSWSYPDRGFKVGGVPLYSGFMYASVASYLMQAWRRHNMMVENFPAWWMVLLISAAIYANFFSARVFGDVRWYLVTFVYLCFGRTYVHVDAGPGRWRVNLLFGFLGLGTLVWITENVCTALHAWEYPYQRAGWQWVDLGKLSSWCLLVILSFLAVSLLKRSSFRAKSGLSGGD